MRHWVIESTTIDLKQDELAEIAKSKGHTVERWTYIPFMQESGLKLDPSRNWLFHGTVNGCELLSREDHLNLLISWHPHIYEYDQYITRLEGMALNSISDGIRCLADEVSFHLEKHGDRFIKPNAPNKPFPGSVVSHADDNKEWRDILRRYRVPENEIVWLFPPRQIIREYRATIINDKIAGCTQYKGPGSGLDNIRYPDSLFEYIDKVINLEIPKPSIWVIDVGQLPDYRFQVVELSGWSAAGLYQSDLRGIVACVDNMI